MRKGKAGLDWRRGKEALGASRLDRRSWASAQAEAKGLNSSLGKEMGCAGRKWSRPETEEGERIYPFLFLISFQRNFEDKIQIKFKFEFKSNHSKINMQQHACTHMVIDLFFILIQ